MLRSIECSRTRIDRTMGWSETIDVTHFFSPRRLKQNGVISAVSRHQVLLSLIVGISTRMNRVCLRGRALLEWKDVRVYERSCHNVFEGSGWPIAALQDGTHQRIASAAARRISHSFSGARASIFKCVLATAMMFRLGSNNNLQLSIILNVHYWVRS